MVLVVILRVVVEVRTFCQTDLRVRQITLVFGVCVCVIRRNRRRLLSLETVSPLNRLSFGGSIKED